MAAALGRHGVETFVVDADQPGATLRAELDARRLKARTVAIGLPRGSVTVKPIELPPVAGVLRDMVKFELERHLPFPAEDAPFDFLPLPVNGDAGLATGRRVLVAAADRRIVDSAVRLVEEARLRPVSVTLAAHDLVGLARVPTGKHIVWTHRTTDATDLIFIGGGSIVLSRSVPTTDESRVTDEIRKSFTVTRWRGCDAVWVSGDGGPPIKNTITPLHELAAPVTEPPYTQRARKLLAGAEETSGASMLAIAVAAGRGVRPLDLIPDALRPRRLTRPQLITLGMAGFMILLAVIALLAPGYRARRHLAALNADITRMAPDVRGVEKVLGELEAKRRLVAMIESLEATAIRPLPVLRDLTDLLPGDAWLTTVSLDNKGIELTGQAAAASALIPVLENSPRFARVEFASPVTRGRDREQFRIRAAWETPTAASDSTLGGSAAVAMPPPFGPPPAGGGPTLGGPAVAPGGPALGPPPGAPALGGAAPGGAVAPSRPALGATTPATPTPGAPAPGLPPGPAPGANRPMPPAPRGELR
ncbi:MAG TPA: PilN domain-containing protein [Methylomirabilota bacterium]